ncbi:MAG: hypothetical protein K2W93_00145 [Burkholderiaceae bacterium]|nr:hypothetical protein [Burkholderiaceae bacterium]
MRLFLKGGSTAKRSTPQAMVQVDLLGPSQAWVHAGMARNDVELSRRQWRMLGQALRDQWGVEVFRAERPTGELVVKTADL